VEPGLYPKVEYNISHDGQYVLFGTTRGKRVGVDIMAIPATPDEVEEALSDHVSSSSPRCFLALPPWGRNGSNIQMTISERRGMALPPLSQGEGREINKDLVPQGSVCESYRRRRRVRITADRRFSQ